MTTSDVALERGAPLASTAATAGFDGLDRPLARLPHDIWLAVELTAHPLTRDPTAPEDDAHG